MGTSSVHGTLEEKHEGLLSYHCRRRRLRCLMGRCLSRQHLRYGHLRRQLRQQDLHCHRFINEYIFAGNGAFINGDNTFTGYDGTSSDVNVVVFFSQSADADGNLDNSTCWDASVSCADSGADYSGPFFMENVNDHRNAKNGNYNIQIANVNNGDVLSIQLMNNDGGEYGAQNITAGFGTVGATADAWGNQYSDDGTFTVTVGDAVFGQLFQISVVQQPGNTGVLSMWSSTVSN